MTFPAILSLIAATALVNPSAAAPQPGPWMQYADPADAGFSARALERVRERADSLGSGAVMIVHRGRVVAAWGDVEREFRLHSVRKSLVSALYGPAVAEGSIPMEATLGALGVEDDTGLSATERTARVVDLLAARSGVYLPAAYAPSDQDETRPARGSHRPGSSWFYNNWDFNVSGVLYERLTGEPLYEAFERRIAGPIGMEDFEPADGFLVYEPSASRHPAHTFRMSTRDLARFGQLALQQGRWDGREVIPGWWIRESTRPHSDFGNGTGYGLMWWTYSAGFSPDRYPEIGRHDFFMARGTGGQALFVLPGADLVIVHRGDTDNGREIEGVRVWEMAEAIVAARSGAPPETAALAPMKPIPFRSQLPAPAEVYLPAEGDDLSAILGEYRVENGPVVRIFEFRGRPFGAFPGEGEAELFKVGEDEWTIRVQAGVRLRFHRADDGRAGSVAISIGPRTMVARRVAAADPR